MREQAVETLYQEIEPALQAMELRRIKAAKNNGLLQVALAVAFSIVFIVIMILAPIPFPVNLVVLATILAICINFRNHYKESYLNKYKKDLTQIIFSQFGVKTTHEPTEYIYSSYFKASDLFSYANTFSGDDLIKGQKGGLYFLGSELKAKYTESRENSPDIDRLIFDGFYFCGQIKKDTGTTVTIHSTDFSYQNPKRRGEQIPDYEFESLNAEFDQHFRLDYSDYDRTSYILTPEFMQKLLDFKSAHKYPFVIRIARNQVYIAIQEQKEFFKLQFKESANSKRHINILTEDSHFFFDLIRLLERL